MVLAEDVYLSFFSQFISIPPALSLLILFLSDGTGRFWERRRFTARNSGYRVLISRRRVGSLVCLGHRPCLHCPERHTGVINQLTLNKNPISSFSSFCGFCSRI